MKKVLLCFLILFLFIFNTIITSNALEPETPYYVPGGPGEIASVGANIPFSPTSVSNVPKIEIVTENGNGTQLLKADGYVNAQISITDTDGSVLADDILFKVRGNSTAIDSIAKKAFTFKFDKKKDVLGMGKGKKWALLANCFDPTLLRNYLVFDFARDMGLPYVSEQRFAELWLDGEYRGCYTVYEPVQEGKDRVDIDIESNDGKSDFLLEYEASRTEADVAYITAGGLRFALKDPEEPDGDQLAYISEIMANIVNVLRSGNENIIRQTIDVDSFAKFYLLNEYAKTGDFGLSSVFFFYKDGVLYAGPPWDYDLSLGNLNGDLNSSTAKAASVSDGIMQDTKNFYRWLCDKEWFQSEIKRVYYRYYPYVENISADGGLLDSLKEQYADVFANNFSKWSVGRWWLNYQKVPFRTYDENFVFLKNWCRDRNTWLANYYGIVPDAVLLGDADRDREVTIFDVTYIQRRLSHLTIPMILDLNAADVDGNGTLEVSDATYLQRYLVNTVTPYRIGSWFDIGAI